MARVVLAPLLAYVGFAIGAGLADLAQLLRGPP